MQPSLSIVIPAYNEENTLEALLARACALDIPGGKEVIVVDDGSTDRTSEILARIKGDICVLTHPKNMGKGAAVRTGFTEAQGTYVVVQDADLEYDPEDLGRMFRHAVDTQIPVLYGSRRLSLPNEKTVRGSWYFYLGGIGVTWFANLLYGIRITDEPTCYKMIKKDVLKRLMPLQSTGFEFCPEVTAKITRLRVPIREIPIHYAPRSKHEGKKIRAKDGIIALWTLCKYRFWNPKNRECIYE